MSAMIFMDDPNTKLGQKVFTMAGNTEYLGFNSSSDLRVKVALPFPILLILELGILSVDFDLDLSIIGSRFASKRGTIPSEVMAGSISQRSAGFKGLLKPFQSNDSAQK